MERFIVPNYIETKGSLFLRSNQKRYGKHVLTSNWHKVREAEPKDYDIQKHTALPERNLLFSTYKRFGSTGKMEDKSTTHAAMEQLTLAPLFQQQNTVKKIITTGTYANVDIDRKLEEKTLKETGWHSLPRHPEGHDKMHLDTTHQTDYQPPYPFVSAPPKDLPDNTAAFRKCVSQFTDVDMHKRDGVNTYHDQSAVYSNQQLKSQVFVPTDPILQRLA